MSDAVSTEMSADRRARESSQPATVDGGDSAFAARLRVRVVEGQVIAVLPQRLDFSNSDDIRSILLRTLDAFAAHGAPGLLLDLTATTSCDAEAVHMLAGLSRRTRALGCQMRLIVPEANTTMRGLLADSRLPGDVAIYSRRRIALHQR